MKNIHLIPTDKPSRLIKDFNNKLLLTNGDTKFLRDGYQFQNIYITSDEDIKDVRLHKGKWQLEKGYILNKFPTYLTDLSECKLAIMTTDQDLIKDGVQAIDDEFLEWFVKNPSCKEVEVVVMNKGYNKSEDVPYEECYRIIIPQEEPKQGLNLPLLEQKLDEALSNETEESLNTWLKEKRDKQETTIEEVAKNESEYLADWEDKEMYQKGFIEGAKWQQERSYSEEEVNEIIAESWNSCEDNEGETFTEARKRILEQFKKK